MNTGEITIALGLIIVLLLMFVGSMAVLLNKLHSPARPYYDYERPPYDEWRRRRAPVQQPVYRENGNGCLEILIYTGVVLSFFTTVGFIVFLNRLLNSI